MHVKSTVITRFCNSKMSSNRTTLHVASFFLWGEDFVRCAVLVVKTCSVFNHSKTESGYCFVSFPSVMERHLHFLFSPTTLPNSTSLSISRRRQQTLQAGQVAVNKANPTFTAKISNRSFIDHTTVIIKLSNCSLRISIGAPVF